MYGGALAILGAATTLFALKDFESSCEFQVFSLGPRILTKRTPHLNLLVTFLSFYCCCVWRFQKKIQGSQITGQRERVRGREQSKAKQQSTNDMKRQRDGEDGGDGSDGENKQSAINGQQQRQPVRTLAPMKRARTTTTTTATAQLATISFNIKPAAAAAVAVPVCSSEKHVRPFVKPELFTKIADAIDLDEAVRNAALECLLNLQQPPSTSTSSVN